MASAPQLEEPAASLLSVDAIRQRQRELEPQVAESNQALIALLVNALPLLPTQTVRGHDIRYRYKYDAEREGGFIQAGTDGGRTKKLTVHEHPSEKLSDLEWELHADGQALVSQIYASLVEDLGDAFSGQHLADGQPPTVAQIQAAADAYRELVKSVRADNTAALDTIWNLCGRRWSVKLAADPENGTTGKFWFDSKFVFQGHEVEGREHLGFVVDYRPGWDAIPDGYARSMAVPFKNPGGVPRVTIVTKDKRSKANVAVITDGHRLDPGELSFHTAIPQIMEQIVERARQQLGDLVPADAASVTTSGEHPTTASAAIEAVNSLQAAVEPALKASTQAVMALIYDAVPEGDQKSADFYRPEIDPNTVFRVGETVYQPEGKSTILITRGERNPQAIDAAEWYRLKKDGFFEGTGAMAEWDVHVDTPQLIKAVHKKFALALTKAGVEIIVHDGVTVEDARAVMDQYRAFCDTTRDEIEQAREHMVAKLPADWSMIIPTPDETGAEQPLTYVVENGKIKAKSDGPDATTSRVDRRRGELLTSHEIAFAGAIPKVMGQITQLISHQMAGL